MNTEKDPLRFLKERKKTFHNTPHKEGHNSASRKHTVNNISEAGTHKNVPSQDLVKKQQNKAYNPLKYFSQEVQQFLNSKHHNQFTKPTHNSERSNQHINQQQHINHREQAVNNKLITLGKQQSEYLNEKKQQVYDIDHQLKQCEICGRKFNPNSYAHHIKVCQSVFFCKRKQFSSKKQRSSSCKQKQKQ